MADMALVRRLADASHLAILATTRSDGTVHASLVSAGVLDDPIEGFPAIGVVAGGGARKLDHLRMARRAAAVFTKGHDWVSVEGRVRIIGPDDPSDVIDSSDLAGLLRDVFRAAGGTHEDWGEFDRVMAEERRAAVLIKPERVQSNG